MQVKQLIELLLKEDPAARVIKYCGPSIIPGRDVEDIAKTVVRTDKGSQPAILLT